RCVQGGGDLGGEAEVHLGDPCRQDVGVVGVPLQAAARPRMCGCRVHGTKARAVAVHRPKPQARPDSPSVSPGVVGGGWVGGAAGGVVGLVSMPDSVPSPAVLVSVETVS